MDHIETETKQLEKYIGFHVRRKSTTIESDEPHDETFSYGLCQRFYGKEHEMKLALKSANHILLHMLRHNTNGQYSNDIGNFYSLIGNMHYILGSFEQSTDCFLKELSYKKNDMTAWAELMFSIRSAGNFNTFEKIMFNRDIIHVLWEIDEKNVMNTRKLQEMLDYISEAKISSINNAVIKLGYTCNNNCIICHARDNRKIPDSNTLSIKKKIILARKNGAFMVIFSGGEPTIRNDINEISRFAKAIGLSVGIASNGRMFSYHEFLGKMLESGLRYAYVSLHGLENCHEKVTRVKGSFKQTATGIRNLLDAGVDTVVNIVVTGLNVSELKEMVDFLRRMDKNEKLSIEFSFINPKGAANHGDMIIPSIKQCGKMVSEAITYAQGFGIRTRIRDLPFCVVWPYYCMVSTFTDCGITHMSEADETDFFPVDHESKTKCGACESCSMSQKCEGVFKEYLNLKGCDGIKAIAEMHVGKNDIKTFVKDSLILHDKEYGLFLDIIKYTDKPEIFFDLGNYNSVHIKNPGIDLFLGNKRINPPIFIIFSNKGLKISINPNKNKELFQPYQWNNAKNKPSKRVELIMITPESYTLFEKALVIERYSFNSSYFKDIEPLTSLVRNKRFSDTMKNMGLPFSIPLIEPFRDMSFLGVGLHHGVRASLYMESNVKSGMPAMKHFFQVKNYFQNDGFVFEAPDNIVIRLLELVYSRHKNSNTTFFFKPTFVLSNSGYIKSSLEIYIK